MCRLELKCIMDNLIHVSRERKLQQFHRMTLAHAEVAKNIANVTGATFAILILDAGFNTIRNSVQLILVL